ncbi:MAG: formate acetyltransferase [Deltaproteobacteria bacterium]|nr:formate acetyltransferase [Deltaproteobacteria bacterium]
MLQQTVDTSRSWLAGRLTPAVVQAKLTAMAAAYNYLPPLRRHLRDRHPKGTPFRFEASIQFVDWKCSTGAHAVFRDGKMHVGGGPLPGADTTLRFRSLDHMQAFFSGGDSLHMLLENDMAIEGMLSNLLKFAHMSEVLRLRGRKLRAAPRPITPRRWQDLEAYPAGAPCKERPDGECVQLDDPYLAGYTLDDFPRIKRQLWAFRTLQPAICTERARLWTESWLEAPDRKEPAALRQARALHHLLTHRQAIIHDDDLLAGTTTSQRIGIPLYPELGALGIWPELLTVEARKLNPYRISDRDIEILDREVFPFWMRDNLRDWNKIDNDYPEAIRLDERFVLYFLWKTNAVSHTVANVPAVLDRGLADIAAEAHRRREAAGDPAKRAFYSALQLACEGVIDYARRLGAKARELARSAVGDRRTELVEMARVCEKVPAQPSETLHEAIQAIWILFACQHQESFNAGLAVGRLDSWLEPYFQRDMQGIAGAGERRDRIERAIELVCALCLKLTDHLPLVPDMGNRLFGGSSSDQVITLGGQGADGSSAVGDMTWIFLKAVEMLRLRDPNVNARYAPGVNSKAYLRRLCEVNMLTGATPSLHNDDAVVPTLIELGFEPAHARDWTATGCVEPTSCGRHYGHTNCMMFNMVAPLEMAFHDGVHPLLGERIGPRTGDPAGFTSYEQLLEAYKRQFAWLFGKSVEGNNMLGRSHQRMKPTPLLSALFSGPMDKGEDLIDGGAIYNSSGTAMVGLTDVVDSLAAIETLCFQGKRFDMRELLAALDADFAGHEQLHAMILHKAPKFGRDEALPRRIAAELQDFIYAEHRKHDNYRGGKYVPGYWSMSNHVAFGTLSGALPSGRRRGKAFTPGLTPSHLSRAPLTEQIRTVAGLDRKRIPNNIAFNVKVAPGAPDSREQVLDRMAAYVLGYFELGGMQMQFNVMRTETLREAQRNPDAYRDLMVRISGYNAYFVELNEDIQQEIIERMEHELGVAAR